MEKKKEDVEGHIPSHGIFSKKTETTTQPNERTHKTPSRRGKTGRHQKQSWTLPARDDPTREEQEMLSRLKDLVDASGGIQSEDRVLTVVMIMTEDRRPIVHDRLLTMMGQSSEHILKKLLESHQFLIMLERWLEMYVKSEAWSDVTGKLLEVIGKLPLKRGDEHNFKVSIRRLSSHGVSASIDRSMKEMLHRWEDRRKEQEAAGNLATRDALSRLHSWPKRKVGKAYVATYPSAKLSKLVKKKSGPAGRRSSSVGTPYTLGQGRTPIRSEGLTPEAMDALRKLRMKKALDASKSSLPSSLMHSMDAAPTSPNFYLQQRSLYDALRLEKERSTTGLDDMDVIMSSEIPWRMPSMCRLPEGGVIRAPFETIERSVQDERERTVPPSDSGLLFSSLLESVTSDAHKPVFEFSFFPRNREQYEQQKKVCIDAGVAQSSVLEGGTQQHP